MTNDEMRALKTAATRVLHRNPETVRDAKRLKRAPETERISWELDRQPRVTQELISGTCPGILEEIREYRARA